MNRLAQETSPYLLQHAHNPVDWFPWGPEAWEKARAENKPVFLSIGYSACHWCHVMERESFEDPSVAEILNRHFVSIKVDREERPDIDSIYMQAVQMMTGHGGWPMSMFLDPAGRPFYAGTYFPPDDRHGLPSFRRVLDHVVTIFGSRRGDVDEAAAEIERALSSHLHVRPQHDASIGHEALNAAAERIAAGYDRVHGGFGSSPKFPPSMSLDFLMQVAARKGESRLREIVVHTLRRMADGGLYDQVGGGFHRYSVDAQWLVPHFEKMLYDNALLTRLYTRAWQWTREPMFARVVSETIGFILREMTSPEGAFFSTLDADSEREEGKFYVWSRAEVMDVLGEEEGRAFCALYDISEAGNWEGANILNVPRRLENIAADLGLSVERLVEIAQKGKCKLYGVRSERVWPARDEKVLTGWNGWMLAAMAEAALAFDHTAWRDAVRNNAAFLIDRIDGSGRIIRHARIPGLLEDYAGAAWGLTLAFEATQERRFLDAASGLITQVLERFRDEPQGGFFDTPLDHEKLITRPKDLFDNATPSGTSVMCDVLLRHALIFGREDCARLAEEAMQSVWPLAERYPSGFGFMLGAAEWRSGKPKEIAITGSGEAFEALRREAGQHFLPHKVVVGGPSSADLPLMQNRPQDRAVAYVCSGYVCDAPATTVEELRLQLSRP
jgi:uncharacterized protein YyaL (SSP411 family)